jgi:hypothetical protein
MLGIRVRVTVVALALVAASSVVGGVAAQATTKLPAPLVGAWERSITAADWARNGITSEVPIHASMLVSADGSVISVEQSDIRFAPLSGSRIVISHAFGCGRKKSIYRWKVTAGRLTLTKLQGSCAYSDAIYAGVWKREKT